MNTQLGVISEEGPTACNQNGGKGYLWDQWTRTEMANLGANSYIYENVWNLECIYDNTQEPAIRSLAPASIISAADSRTFSRRARSAAVSPPPSGYLMIPAYPHPTPGRQN